VFRERIGQCRLLPKYRFSGMNRASLLLDRIRATDKGRHLGNTLAMPMFARGCKDFEPSGWKV
jgi:hypothetical protein